MSDWPQTPGLLQPHSSLTTYGPPSGLNGLKDSMALTTGTNWSAAQRAVFVPIRLSAPFWGAQRAYWINGTVVSSTIDVGIYDAKGTKLTSTGAVTQSGTSALQAAALTTTIDLPPGTYYLALLANSGTARLAFGTPTLQFLQQAGCASQDVAAATLPATAALASLAAAQVPFIGITQRSTP